MPGSQPTPTRSKLEPVPCAQARPDCKASEAATNSSARGSGPTRIRARRIRHGKIMFASRALPAANSKQATRNVDHVAVLDVCWCCCLAANSRPKVNRFTTLYTVDDASKMDVAGAAIVTRTSSLHNCLVHRRRAIEGVCTRLIGKACHGHSCRAVLQRHQNFVVFKLPSITADDLMLKIDNSLAGSCDFADKRQAYLAVSANFLRLIRNGLVGIGSLDHIPGRKPYRCFRTGRIRQRR